MKTLLKHEPQEQQPSSEPGNAVRSTAQKACGRMRGQGAMGRRDAVLQDVGEQLEQIYQLDFAAVLQEKVIE